MKEGKKCSKPDLESALLEGGMLVEEIKMNLQNCL